MTSGEMIKRIRKDKRITIVELAHRMGVSQAYIVRIERGEIQANAEQIEVLMSFIESSKGQDI